MTTNGLTDMNVKTNYVKDGEEVKVSHGKSKHESLCLTTDRQDRRPDGDVRRNCLTSMIYMPTIAKGAKFFLCVNASDHMHYWQGGLRFEYLVYDPDTAELKRYVLGPNLTRGEVVQVPVAGGVWKCGRLLVNDDDKRTDTDYCLIGEAVAPGFDFHDFRFVSKAQLMAEPNAEHRARLLEFVHEELSEMKDSDYIQHSATFY